MFGGNRERSIEELIDGDAAISLPGRPGDFLTCGLEDGVPDRIKQDLESGALRLPEGYYGMLAVVIPNDAEGKGQSVAFAIGRDIPDESAEKHPELILPMFVMSVGLMFAPLLNAMMFMPWLIQQIGSKILVALLALRKQVELDLEEFQRRQEKQKEETVQ